uniref:Putative secreted protein n=1 Tax=Ixodes ricinus TaxID=34613 RepID=A0A6B0U1G5_IXORI
MQITSWLRNTRCIVLFLFFLQSRGSYGRAAPRAQVRNESAARALYSAEAYDKPANPPKPVRGKTRCLSS